MKYSDTYWCNNCQVPLLKSFCEACGEESNCVVPANLRPVFHEELEFVSKRTGTHGLERCLDYSIWASHRYYFHHGNRIAHIIGGSYGKPLALKFLEQRNAYGNGSIRSKERFLDKLLRANYDSLKVLEYEAIEFIQQNAAEFSTRVPVVSFSGGKDSIITSYLVRKALGKTDVLHVFADTTIESPHTYDYISRFRSHNPRIPFLLQKPNADFYEMCAQIGPPSRIKRWCCTTHKVYPLSTAYKNINGRKGVLSFGGIRRAESARRAEHERILRNTKIANEVFASPIIEWTDTQVWIFILTRQLPINESYRLGFVRIGCLLCPFNSQWSEILSAHHYPHKMENWRDFLIDYYKSCGRRDARQLVDSGGWKTRAGGANKNDNRAIVFREACDQSDNSYGFDLATSWHEGFWEYLKPLGKRRILYDDGTIAEACITGYDGQPMLMLRVSRPRNHIRVTILADKYRRLLLQRFERQIRKFQSCILCGACVSICGYGAISVNGEYSIDEGKCVGCLDCVRAFGSGCVVAHSLSRTSKYSNV